MATLLRRTALILVALVLAVVLYYAAMYSYLYVKAVFTWQCQIYTGEMSTEGRKVCEQYNSGGLYKVLTN